MRKVTASGVAGLVLAGLVQFAWSAPTVRVAVSASTASVEAGTSNSLIFTYTADEQTNARLQLVVPAVSSGAPWSAPQITNQTQPGYVLAQRGSCESASTIGVDGSGAGPWTILVEFKCHKQRSFSVVYGAGPAAATAPTRTGPYTFASLVKTGPGFLPLAPQPAIAVTPGAATSLDLTGLSNAQAGTGQSVTVTALDAYGNTASGYGGTVWFTSTDSQASLPGALTFSAANAGVRTATVMLKTAGARQVVVTDTATASLTDRQTVVVSPGPAVQINVRIPAVTNAGKWVALTGWLFSAGGSCFADVVDAFGNPTSLSGGVRWRSSDPEAALPNDGPLPFNPFCDFATVGQQTLTVTSMSNPAVTGSLSFAVTGPEAKPDSISNVDPAHSGIPIYALDVMGNDSQTNTLQPCYLPTQPAAGGCVHKQTIDLESIGQAQTTKAGVLYQVGLIAVTTDGHFLVWDLDPPAGTVPSVAGATLLRCPVAAATSADVCHISDPMQITYGITDGVNVSSSTLTLTLETPSTPPISATTDAKIDSSNGNVYIYPTGANSSVPMLVYVPINLNIGTYDAGTGVANTTFQVPLGGTTVAIGTMDILLTSTPPAGQPIIVTFQPPPLQNVFGYKVDGYAAHFTPVLTVRRQEGQQGASNGYTTTPGWHYNIDRCIDIPTGAVISCP
jgi:hypothetical protein